MPKEAVGRGETGGNGSDTICKSALDWKTTLFQTSFAMSLSKSPKPPKVVRKIIWQKLVKSTL